ncbi:IS66 family transposase [Patescibacteria group bacterium]|nr:IS66 family transposase [Patescibacteria group bacterium]
MPVKPPKGHQVSGKQLKALQERIKERKLAEADWEIVQGLAETVQCLSLALAEKDASLGRLCKYLFGAPTETAKNVLKNLHQQQANEKAEKPQSKKGHGRKPASAYNGGKKVTIEHPTLNTGDRCPGCEKGKIYELAMPSVFVHVVGDAPLKATVYERIRLRCNLCGEVFVPELPPEAGEKKHDESAGAMLALLKYGCGLPLHRLEKLQANLGHPLPASTQWDILNASAVILSPVHDALVQCAAQGELIHNDDTAMKVLSFLKQQDPENTRKGIYTTGIVSKWQGRQMALFMTGNRHAGENLAELLKRRKTGLSPPIQMCDAASRNASEDFETILANCMAHARRQFVELINSFPDECTYVIELLAKVYHHDAIVKEQGLSPEQRLDYHQRQSGPIMAELEAWCKKQIDENIVEPNSGLGKAIKYMLKHWVKLTRFLKVPGAPLDNNLCERALKHAILHRKNALFYKTQRGAYVGDLFMSLIHTCQLAGVNPLHYLTWLPKNAQDLEKTPENYMPWHYAQPQSSSQ